jgi:hypothetical protein
MLTTEKPTKTIVSLLTPAGLVLVSAAILYFITRRMRTASDDIPYRAWRSIA